MNRLKEQVLTGIKWTILHKIFSSTISLLTSLILIRYLTKDDFGTYGILLTINSVLIYFVSLGLQHSISRFVPEYLEKRHYNSINKLITRFTVIRLLVVIFVLLILFILWDNIAIFFNLPKDLTQLLPIIMAFFLLQRTTEVFGNYFHSALLDFKTITFHDTVRPLIIMLGVMLASRMDLGFKGVLLVLLLGEIFSFLFYSSSAILRSYQFKALENNSREKSPSLDWKRIGNYSFYNMFYTLGGITVGTTMDNFIIAHYFSMAEVATYTFSLLLVMSVHSLNPITLFKGIFNNIFIRKYTQAKDKIVLLKGFELSIKIGLFLGLPAMLGLCFAAPYIISYIYKKDYLDSLQLIYIFAFMCLFRYITFGLTTIINTLELNKYLLFFNVLSIYNIVAAILLAPVLGLKGVALSTCSTEIFWCIYLWFIVQRKAKLKLVAFNKSFFAIVLNTAVLIIVFYFLKNYIINIFSLIIIVLICCSIYFIFSFFNKVFKSDERNMINELFKKKIWVF